VSIGIATTLPNELNSFTDLLALADEALVEAKALGRSQATKLRL
jgi:PleD family two-component response regulator